MRIAGTQSRRPFPPPYIFLREAAASPLFSLIIIKPYFRRESIAILFLTSRYYCRCDASTLLFVIKSPVIPRRFLFPPAILFVNNQTILPNRPLPITLNYCRFEASGPLLVNNAPLIFSRFLSASSIVFFLITKPYLRREAMSISFF